MFSELALVAIARALNWFETIGDYPEVFALVRMPIAFQVGEGVARAPTETKNVRSCSYVAPRAHACKEERRGGVG